MRLRDKITFIRQNMKKNRSRVWMTILATAIGCAFLIVLASVGFGAQKFIVDDIMQDRTLNEVGVHGKEVVEEGENPGIGKKDIKKFENMDGVKAISKKLTIRDETVFYYDDYMATVMTSAVDFSTEQKAGLELSEGRMPEKPNEIVVGYHFVDSLYKKPSNGKTIPPEQLYDENGEMKKELRYTGEEGVLGKEIVLEITHNMEGKEEKKEFPLTIVGIGEAPSRDWMRDENVLVSTSVLDQIEAFTGTPLGEEINSSMEGDQQAEMEPPFEREYGEVNVIATSMEDVKAISESLKNEGYYIYSVTEELEEINLVFAVIKVGLVFIGTIALLIASIGIYNTMSMAVTERTQDIGIMKAIGGHPKMIKRIFLMESSYIGFIGAIVGVIAAYLISMLVNGLMPMVIQQVFSEETERVIKISYIPTYLSVLCVFLSMGVAMLSGLKPAKKATKIDVLSALRRDI
jgi:acetoin utilization transport system permease protein